MHSPEVLHKEPETQIPENILPNIVDIPKSREIFSGDINDAVIKVQQITGYEITPQWWAENVGNEGPTEDILDRFDAAFEQFVREEMGVDVPEVSEDEVIAEAEAELAHFDEQFADNPGAAPLREEFIDALGVHLKEKYYPGDMSDAEREDTNGFGLTAPIERLFTPDEPYRFLVHVPLGDVFGRGEEIGEHRGGVLMTSLVTNQRQGTFQGYGGFILRQPEEDKVRGMSPIDVGGEIPDGQKTTVESLAQPADLTEYNQIDIDFDSTAVEAVLIKVTADGTEIGRASTNESLRQYAKEHDLPVVQIEVKPMELPSDAEVREEVLPNDKGEMLYVSVPFGEGLMQCRVLRASNSNKVYNKLDGNRLAGTSKINKFGEYDQILSIDEETTLVDGLRELQSSDSRIKDLDIEALQNEIRRLRQEQIRE